MSDEKVAAPTLSEFLQARLAEEPPSRTTQETWSAAEAEAAWKASQKRILAMYAPLPGDEHPPGECLDCDIAYRLARPYADHPDFRPEWRID